MTASLRVLVVDDEEVIRDILATLLEREGWHVTTASTAGRALTLFEADPYDVVLLDLMLPDRSGLELLKDLRRRDPDAVVVIVTAYSSIEGAIEAMRDGAFHYIPKPFQNEEVLLTVKKGAETRRLTEENRRLKEELSRRFGLGRIVGKSEGMRKVFELVRLAGPSKSTILVEGESGTGKELVARAIHTHSPRSGGPFVTVNCGAMPTDLLESSLFGHVRGAFTGAVADKKGLFESAEGGTIFFDEIGTVGLETQAEAAARASRRRNSCAVGSVDTQKADVRIIAATNVDLKRMVAEGRFREDLYYRLCVITISIPPLRDRREDIPLLARALRARLRVREQQTDHRAVAATRCGRCSTTTGRATSASSRTRSSGPSCCALAVRSSSSSFPRASSRPIGRSCPFAFRRTVRPTRISSRNTNGGWSGRLAANGRRSETSC